VIRPHRARRAIRSGLFLSLIVSETDFAVSMNEERVASGARCESTMTIHITLTPDEERKLTELASARGKDPAAHAHDVVSANSNGENQTGTKSLAEILAPIWEGWRDSGMTDGEVDELFKHELRQARGERR
jgi:hypothetical protein